MSTSSARIGVLQPIFAITYFLATGKHCPERKKSTEVFNTDACSGFRSVLIAEVSYRHLFMAQTFLASYKTCPYVSVVSV